MQYSTNGKKYVYLYKRHDEPITKMKGFIADSIKELFRYTKKVRLDESMMYCPAKGIFGFEDKEVNDNDLPDL